MKSIYQTARDLIAVGACLALSYDRTICEHCEGKPPSYHVHPDQNAPWGDLMLHFPTLAAVQRYVKDRQEAQARK